MRKNADVLCVIGTRPEVIKFAPVIHALATRQGICHKTLVTGQQADLLETFLRSQGITADYALNLMRPGEDFGAFLRRAIAALIPIVAEVMPRSVMVQGDTSSAFAGAVVAAAHGIPVIHIEAGLRSGDTSSPYPEEALRTLISHCASLHCAPTRRNVESLLGEGIDGACIFETGNPVVDAVRARLDQALSSASVIELLARTTPYRRVILTLHRRENFGPRLRDYFAEIRRFIAGNEDAWLICPVHPNPNVRHSTTELLGNHARISLIDPLDYDDFLGLVANAALILSDSGGIQEEVATLGVPLMILRSVTERPEILSTGLATLTPDARALRRELDHISTSGQWPRVKPRAKNPFGDGHSGERIATLVEAYLARLD